MISGVTCCSMVRRAWGLFSMPVRVVSSGSIFRRVTPKALEAAGDGAGDGLAQWVGARHDMFEDESPHGCSAIYSSVCPEWEPYNAALRKSAASSAASILMSISTIIRKTPG